VILSNASLFSIQRDAMKLSVRYTESEQKQQVASNRYIKRFVASVERLELKRKLKSNSSRGSKLATKRFYRELEEKLGLRSYYKLRMSEERSRSALAGHSILPFQFDQSGKQLRSPMHPENIARDFPFRAMGHKRLAPKAEQRFRTAVGVDIR